MISRPLNDHEIKDREKVRTMILTGESRTEDTQWVKEVRAEIRRLSVRIDRLNKKIASDEHRSEDYEDLDNWTGWLHGLKWCLNMRDGTATRKDAWGRP